MAQNELYAVAFPTLDEAQMAAGALCRGVTRPVPGGEQAHRGR
jgi:hypothetical protein